MSPRAFIVGLLSATLAATGLLAAGADAQPTNTPAISYDVNGDGYRDLLVGAPGDNNANGSLYLGLGSPAGFTAGNRLYSRSQVLVSADFNGDGYADIASADIGGRVVTVDYLGHRKGGTQYLNARRKHSPADAGGSVTDDTGFGFGWSLAAGDFNDDGYSDLALGHPYADVPISDQTSGAVATGDAGVVLVRYGSPNGLDNSGLLSPDHYEEWNDRTANVDGGVGEGDHFGYSVTNGDVNGDGIDDLLVGIPGKTIGDIQAAGAVTEIFGSTSGLSAESNATFSLATPGVKGEPAQQKDCDEDDGCYVEGENFGAALASGDIDGDGFGDVAIGTPDKAVVAGAHDGDGNPGHDGSLSVLFGASTGITARSQYITYNTPGVPGRVATQGAGFARFAAELVMGDFNGDGHADVAAAAGCECQAVLVFRGNDRRLRTHHVHQLSGTPLERHDNVIRGVGTSMLAVDLDNDGRTDLVAGAPGARIAGANAAGAIAVFRGGYGGLVQRRAQLLTERRPFGGSNSNDNQFGWVGAQNTFITGD